jgi:hypothetical protein
MMTSFLAAGGRTFTTTPTPAKVTSADTHSAAAKRIAMNFDRFTVTPVEFI